MKSITFANNKGGVGKTSLSLTVSAELSKHGKTVLIDTDPQANAGGSLINVYSLDCQLADILSGKAEIASAIKKTKIENLSVIASNPLKQDLVSYININAPKERLIFTELNKELEKMGFDFVVYDTSPSFNTFEENILLATDLLFPVLLADKYSFDGLNRFRENLKSFWLQRHEAKPAIKDIIINQFASRLIVDKITTEAFKSNFTDYNYYIIPIDQTFRKCVSSGLTAQFFKSEIKQETLRAIGEITNRILEN